MGKKVIKLLVVILAVYTIFTAPTKAADIVSGVLNFAVDGARSVGIFFDRVLDNIPV
jgi:hypothetical protein